MERTNNAEGTIKWRKEGGGSFRMASGKIIKPGQVFLARPDEIPEGFLDTVVPLEDSPDIPVTPVRGVRARPAGKKDPDELTIEVAKTEYLLKSRGGGWYDVVDSNDKVLNTKALKRQAALDLIKSLE